ncbi:hypothetical protein [Paenibacillus sp. RUD330]|uniref:hypothetical protein n=1 Tax=Paenibacillus sp. RUD330 TaxID=2023772 RepID=UPI000956E859|nr:hypothetical protein [Paenibacillus sp. RUD330]SIR42627.1 hypothetical protein SAMN05880555_3766 [Paenibacillus sp. RU4X]SIR52709.1 hypothetical protein SAMN05880570_3768 [Paenibacillus sp. RU4T]
MSGRNSKPKNTGPAGHPGRLDQFGAKLGSSNEAEFAESLGQACRSEEKRDKAEKHTR